MPKLRDLEASIVTPAKSGILSGMQRKIYALISAVLLASSLFFGCSRPAVPTFFDDFFIMAYPDFIKAWQNHGFLAAAPTFVKIPFNGNPVDTLEGFLTSHPREKAIIASPLLAQIFVQSSHWNSATKLLVPFGMQPPSASSAIVQSDSIQAYTIAGVACKGYLDARRAASGPAVCAIIYLPDQDRNQAALHAFMAAFEGAGGGDVSTKPLFFDLSSTSMNQNGSDSYEQPDSSSSPGATSPVTPLPGEMATATMSAGANIADNLKLALDAIGRSDVGVLFIAAGPQSIGIAEKAARPEILMGADLGGNFPLPGLSFEIRTDNARLVKEIRLASQEKAAPSNAAPGAQEPAPPASSAVTIIVPRQVVLTSAASQWKAGNKTFASFVDSAKKAYAQDQRTLSK